MFVVACDMPLLDAEVVRYVASADRRADVIMPQLAHGLQPTHAVYGKGCLPHLERMARTGQLRLQDIAQGPDLSVRVLPEQALRAIDPDLLSFFNVNAPEDLEHARKLLGTAARHSRRS
jgi:molybdopterin-guanine dinucleotide biosynthesis protein A